jgi:diguanylate cyclase (GGDEF)-like protein
MKNTDNKQVVAAGKLITQIIIIISLVELLIMSLLANALHDLSVVEEALLDALLLSLLSAPFIYFWIIKPFVVARDKAEEQLSHMAYHDPLTHLPNRRFLTEYLKKSLAACSRHDLRGALLLIDLDNFKQINDTYGHDAGDALLVEVAKRLSSIVRMEDIVSRLGGDEFLAAIHPLGDTETDAKHNASIVAEKFLEILSQPFQYGNTTLQARASIGIHMISANSSNMDSAIKEADKAMYQAKRNRKENGRIAFFSDIGQN